MEHWRNPAGLVRGLGLGLGLALGVLATPAGAFAAAPVAAPITAPVLGQGDRNPPPPPEPTGKTPEPGTGGTAGPVVPAPASTPPQLPGGGTVSGLPTAGPDLGPSKHPWVTWWELYKGDFLRVKTAVRRGGTTTGSADFFLGQDASDARPPAAREVRREVVATRILPALLAELDRSGGPDAVIEALLALGRLAPSLTAAEFRPVQRSIETQLRASNQLVAEAAAIALGASSREEVLGTLQHLLADADAGRKLAGGEVPQRMRAYAAYGIGLVARASAREDVRRFAVASLSRTLDSLDRSHSDTATACVLAMGLVPLETWVVRDPGGVPEPVSSSRVAVLRRLEELLGARRTSRLDVRSLVPLALARMGADLPDGRREELKSWWAESVLAAMPRGRRDGGDFTASLALALGTLGDADDDPLDARVRAALLDLASVSELGTRHEALLAIGRVAARPGEGANPWRHRDALAAVLLSDLERGRSPTRAFSATALALAVRGLREQGQPVPESWSDALGKALASARAPEDQVAAAVAIALAGDVRHTALVHETFASVPKGWERCQVALAMGLLGESSSRNLLREFALESAQKPRELRAATEALALIGDHAFAAELVAQLPGLQPQQLQAYATALGAIGEPQAVDALLESLTQSSTGASLRGTLCRALGAIADPRAVGFAQVLADCITAGGGAPPTLFSQAALVSAVSSSHSPTALLVGGGLLNLLQ
ncbi:MAG: hypothetical protein GC161_09705 [Planctomycetaceae bacterium]|nr:hypothetical protein [Planctomycetaceae bacterium]